MQMRALAADDELCAFHGEVAPHLCAAAGSTLNATVACAIHARTERRSAAAPRLWIVAVVANHEPDFEPLRPWRHKRLVARIPACVMHACMSDDTLASAQLLAARCRRATAALQPMRLR